MLPSVSVEVTGNQSYTDQGAYSHMDTVETDWGVYRREGECGSKRERVSFYGA